jgi:hypothetical protein
LLNYSELEAGGVNPRYIQLLERTNFIKRDDSSKGIFPSGELSELYRRFAQDLGHGEALTKSLETVIGEVLNTHYRYIYDELKLRQLAPYVHIASRYNVKLP